MSGTEDTVQTAYGRMDRNSLEEVRSSFDTSALLRMVDDLTAMANSRKSIADVSELRRRNIKSIAACQG